MGIWRIPVDEIDRPGSFASHMNRSIVILLDVLSQLKDHNTLLRVSSMLQRTPDQGKKYLRDVDRQVLAKRALILTVKVLEDNLKKLSGVDEDVALEQAMKFCQLQMATSTQKQSGETPTTPKYSKDCKESFFPSTSSTISPSAPTLTTPSTVVSENVRPADLQPKMRLSHMVQGETRDAEVTPLPTGRDTEPQTTAPTETHSSTAYLTQDEDSEEPLEELSYRHQETHLCQQMKMATVTSSHETARWQEEGNYTQPNEGLHPEHCSSHTSSSVSEPTTISASQTCKGDGSRIKSRVPPNMPKLFIPSSVAKFPPEITVTPPTPTLLSPKGSVSEETKQKLKTAILSAQSAANVKKEALRQPALEILETSSQESSLESDSDDEEDDYMDI